MEIDEIQEITQLESIEEVLPFEIVRKIVNLLSKKNLKKVALVSKFFHRVVCEIEQFKYPLIVTEDTVSINHLFRKKIIQYKIFFSWFFELK